MPRRRLQRLFSSSSASSKGGERAPHILSNIFGTPKSGDVGSTAKKTSNVGDAHTANVEGKSVIKEEITPESIAIEHIGPPPEATIPKLVCGLDRVLFNSGVHTLRDLRTNVYNFNPRLQHIIQPEEFNFDCLPRFVAPFQDTNLHALAKRLGTKYVSSTSSISATMSQIYYVISNMRKLSLGTLSAAFADENRNFTFMTRAPSAVVLRSHGDGLRSIVAEKIDSVDNVLSNLGQSLERLLTVEEDDFKRMLKGAANPYESKGLDGYAHTKAGDLLVRSQLDCYDDRLPRKTFDLKTRATLPVRMDITNYKSHLDYRLHSNHGLFGSYEREFYDMCRSALLKYNFQVRLGNMDGIFVAYHNTAEIFGFQYLTREAMDECLYGNELTGDATFAMVTKVYNDILTLVMPQFRDDECIRLTFCSSRSGNKMTIFAESIPEPGESKAVAPNSAKFKQYTLSCYSTINSYRADDVLLNPFGGDVWRLHYQLAEVAPEPAEFVVVRARATETRKDIDPIDKRDAPFMRAIHDSIKSQRVREEASPSVGPAIIPAWAKL